MALKLYAQTTRISTYYWGDISQIKYTLQIIDEFVKNVDAYDDIPKELQIL